MDLSKLRLKQQIEMEKLRAQVLAYEDEIGSLEKERKRLNQKLREKWNERGERAATEGISVERLAAMEELQRELHDDPDFDGERVGLARLRPPAGGGGGLAGAAAAQQSSLAAITQVAVSSRFANVHNVDTLRRARLEPAGGARDALGEPAGGGGGEAQARAREGVAAAGPRAAGGPERPAQGDPRRRRRPRRPVSAAAAGAGRRAGRRRRRGAAHSAAAVAALSAQNESMRNAVRELRDTQAQMLEMVAAVRAEQQQPPAAHGARAAAATRRARRAKPTAPSRQPSAAAVGPALSALAAAVEPGWTTA